MGSMCVSSCRCCVFVSVVHPITILSAVFCIIYSLLMFVSDAIGDHNCGNVLEYGSCYGCMLWMYLFCLACFCCCNFYVCCM